MNSTLRAWTACLVCAAVAACHHGTSDSTDATGANDAAPTAHVRVVQVTRKSIAETVTAYGTVVARPGHTHSVTVAFESRVRHFLVAPGQLVSAGEHLVAIEPSPAVALQLDQARAAVTAARNDLDATRARFKLELSTNQEVNAAEKAAKDAELELASLESQGVSKEQEVASDITGIVAKIYAQDGQIVAAAAPLAEIVPTDAIEVRLGVEPEDLGYVQVGGRIDVFPINDPNVSAVAGSIRLVTQAVNADTRLVDVYVSLPTGTDLLFGAYVRGEIAARVPDALVVPRSALLPTEGGFTIFTVESGRAVRHVVHAGLENDTGVQVLGDEIHAGDAVVVTGNYELEDGMPVTLRNQP
jgi:membrane fusion protein (multidrug efflux system)